MRIPNLAVLALLAATCVVTPSPASAAASLRIWPIDPVIESGRGAAALWLENRGTTPAVVQVRVFAWRQVDGDDQYDDQDRVVASPPVATIAAGQRQMVRLISPSGQRASGEAAYRVVVDEIPTRTAQAPEPVAPLIRFQMRYSIPLFVYGGGAGAVNTPAALSCAIKEVAGQRIVEIANAGDVHMRLVDVRFEDGQRSIPLAEGLLGYALPQSAIARPLPSGVSGREALSLAGAGAAAPRITMPGCTGR